MTGEADIIQRYLAPLASGYAGAFGLRDDAAVMAVPPGFELITTMDAVASGVHFFPDDDAADIGWKALAVNVSDLVAKGAIPHTYLMSLAFPEAPKLEWLAQFAFGLGEAQVAFGMTLIGGDTDRRSGPVSITISAFGLVPMGAMVRRGTAQIGDKIFVSGSLGDAAMGLKLRGRTDDAVAWGLSADQHAYLVSRYLRPLPRLALAEALRRHARASMDVSDGLLKDLRRMTAASGVGASIDSARLPLSPAAARVLTAVPGEISAILAGGDDYEVLATVSPAHVAAFQTAARAARVTVTQVGQIVEGTGVSVKGADGSEMTFPPGTDGWDHF
jgi:thiamine-monophosphate kinase